MFRSHHKIFIRGSWYSVLPSLDAMISCRIKEAVVGVAQLITALVSSTQPVWRSIASQHSPTMRIKPVILSHTIDWKRLRSLTENKTVLLGGSVKLYISARKVIELWIETRAESRLRLLSWCDSWSLHQDSEELSTSFFWWRSCDEIETSK